MSGFLVQNFLTLILKLGIKKYLSENLLSH